MVQRFDKLGEEQRLLWAHPNFDPSLSDLEVSVYDVDDTLVVTLPAVAVLAPLGMYWTAPWIAPAVGVYKLHWVSVTGSIDYVEELVVATHPTGDEEATVPRKLLYMSAPAGITDGQLTIFDSTMVPWGASPYAVSETVVTGTYQTDDYISLDEEGLYVLYWQSALSPSFNLLQIVYVGAERGLQDVTIHVLDNSETPYTPIDGCAVLASLPDGTPVDQQVTDINGIARFQLVEGRRHVMSLQYAGGLPFSYNNMEIEPLDPDTEHLPAAANQFFFLTSYFPATFNPIERIDQARLSKMVVDVVDFTGRPLQGVGVLVHHQGPGYITDVSTDFFVSSNGGRVYYTDANGHAEVYLLRSIEVTVALEGADVRRFFQVPDVASFSLSSILSGTDDPFEIARPDVYDAPRRTL